MRLLLLVSVFAVAVPDRQDPNVKNAKPLQAQLLGDWLMVKRVTNGVGSDPGDLRMRFTPGNMQHFFNNGTQGSSKFTYTLDTTKKPAGIIFEPGNETGIFKIEGDVLLICLDKAGRYPADFVSLPNSATTFVHLTRIKK